MRGGRGRRALLRLGSTGRPPLVEMETTRSVRARRASESDGAIDEPCLVEQLGKWDVSSCSRPRSGPGVHTMRTRALEAERELRNMKKALARAECMPSIAKTRKPPQTTANTIINPNLVRDALHHWRDDDVATLLESINLEGLQHLQPVGQVDRRFCMYLLSRMDPNTGWVELEDGAGFTMDAGVVRKIGGLKEIGTGKKNILPCDDDRKVLSERAHAILGAVAPASGAVQVSALRQILRDAKPTDLQDQATLDRLRVAYVMLAFTVLLAPRKSLSAVQPEILKLTSNPSEIVQYDFAEYIVQVLLDGAARLQDGLPAGPRKIDADGCLLFLQIACLDYKSEVDYGSENVLTPRVKYYGDLEIKNKMQQHPPPRLNFPVKKPITRRRSMAVAFVNAKNKASTSRSGATSEARKRRISDLEDAFTAEEESNFPPAQVEKIRKILKTTIVAGNIEIRKEVAALLSRFSESSSRYNRLRHLELKETIGQVDKRLITYEKDLERRCMCTVRRSGLLPVPLSETETTDLVISDQAGPSAQEIPNVSNVSVVVPATVVDAGLTLMNSDGCNLAADGSCSPTYSLAASVQLPPRKSCTAVYDLLRQAARPDDADTPTKIASGSMPTPKFDLTPPTSDFVKRLKTIGQSSQNPLSYEDADAAWLLHQMSASSRSPRTGEDPSSIANDE